MGMEAPQVTPKHDYCLIKLHKNDSLVITGEEKDDQKGEIIAVGAGTYYGDTFVKPDLKVGDMVWLKKVGAVSDTPKELLDKGYAFVRYANIMGVINEG